MSRVVIFGGTTEGREAAAAHLQAGDDVTVCVTSDYARKLLPPGVRCLVRPLERREMTAFLRGEAKFDSLDELVAQMEKDCERAKALLG